MKKILLILLMLLPIVGNTGDTNTKDDNKPYNVEFVQALYDGMMDHDFTEMAEEHFADSLVFYIESDSSESTLSQESMVGIFNYILQNTIMYSFEIEPSLGEDGIFYYTLDHYVVTQGDELNGMGLGLAVFIFSSSDNTKIDSIYGL